MGVSNVNVFEKHVEKIVLGVAAAGALFMGYLATQPITVPAPAGVTSPSGGSELGPADIEKAISDQLNKLESQQNSLPQPNPKIPNYPEKYHQLAVSNPLPDDVSAVAVAGFGPKNLQPRMIDIEDGGHDLAWVAPSPVAPEFVHIEARQDQVAAVPIDAANPVPAGMQVQTRTQNSVIIDGYVPVGKMLLEMLQDKYKDIIAQQGVQRALIYRVSVERQEQTPSGWSEWKAVPSTKAAPTPTNIPFGTMKDGDLPANMDIVDNEFKQIVIPDFYQDGQGIAITPPIIARPVPVPVAEESRKLQEEIDALKAPNGFRAATPVATAPSTQPTTMPSDLVALKSLAVVPFTFWDDTVLPNRTYRYRLEIQLVNPTYGWKWGLKDPRMKTVPILSTGKITISQPVTVLSDIAFFIRPSISGNVVDGRVYKQLNGKWYLGEFSAQPGQYISASVQLLNEPGNPRKEVDTGFMLVDAIGDKEKGVKVILKDPSGNLISRDADFNNPDNARLYEASQKLTAATTTAPAEGTVTPVPTRPNGGARPVTPPPATAPATHPTTNRVRVQ
jgi:hypothetical protein